LEDVEWVPDGVEDDDHIRVTRFEGGERRALEIGDDDGSAGHGHVAEFGAAEGV
jgi:hypothetical protein